MKGLEIAESFYNEYGKPMIEKEFPEIKNLLCAGLAGSGSECYGYDDEISADHDFEPGFCIFIPDFIDDRTEFLLSRAYSKLPKEFMGLQRTALNPVGGNRHGVIKTSEFFMNKAGTADGILSDTDWFFIPEYALSEAVNGKIFNDSLGDVTKIRKRLSYYPEDVRLKKLAGHLLNMGQAGQYNYMRCVKRQECAAAQLAVCEYVKSALQCIFLLNKKYMPYYKWSFRALRDLPLLSDLYVSLEFLLESSNTPDITPIKENIIEETAENIIKELKNQNITDSDSINLEDHAYSVNSFIKDSDIRNRHIMYAL